MSYAPRIYIRDYGAPTYRLLATPGAFALSGVAMIPKRALRLVADVATVDNLLLSGDEQSGTDVLLISGESGSLVLTDAQRFSLVAFDIDFVDLGKVEAEPASFALTFNDAGLKRGLRVAATTATFAMTGVAMAPKRALKLAAAAGSFALTGNDIEFGTGEAALRGEPGAAEPGALELGA